MKNKVQKDTETSMHNTIDEAMARVKALVSMNWKVTCVDYLPLSNVFRVIGEGYRNGGLPNLATGKW